MAGGPVLNFYRIERVYELPWPWELSMKRAMIALTLAMSLWSGAAFPQDKSAFVFTAIPDQDETRLVERFTRVAEYLQSKLGVAVKYLPVKSYPAAVTAFTNGQVQLAWFGGFTGVQARRQVPGSEAIAQGAEDVAFKSFIIANTKTGLRPSKEFPKEIAGKSFTFGSRASTSGRLMPEYFIRKAFGRGPDESLRARRLLRRPQPDHPAGAVRRLRGRCARLFGLGARQARPARSIPRR